MGNLYNAFMVELNKARRSAVSLLTGLAFLFIPMVGALFMLILRYPETAKRLGILGAKAQLAAIDASWPSLLNLLSQAVTLGGMIIFSFIAAWVFGREYINKTLKDLLALPTSRTTIVIAKFALITVWSFVFSMVAILVGIAVGLLIKLPGYSYDLLTGYAGHFVIGAILAIIVGWAIGLVANIGRSYFPALGFVGLAVALGQIATGLGWGEYFPWAVVGLYSNLAEPAHLGAVSYIIVALTGLIGIVGTVIWWKYADHAS